MCMLPLIMLSSYKTLVAKGLRKIAPSTYIRARADSSAAEQGARAPKYSRDYSEVGGRYSRRALGVPT